MAAAQPGLITDKPCIPIDLVQQISFHNVYNIHAWISKFSLNFLR